MDKKVDIVMAAYNSEKYIKPQIDSIINQTYPHWRLIINDDLSSDNTLNILSEYKNQYENIEVSVSETRLGARNNFIKTLQKTSADYIMFADHDDVWFNDKISVSMNHMALAEEKFGKSSPILIFTDKTVTDENLKIKAQSHTKSECYNVSDLSLNRILSQNSASGCTVTINGKLKDICNKISSRAIMHDYWFMIAAASFGNIIYINKPTMYYRQHSNNELGAKAYGIKYAFQKMVSGRESLRKSFTENIIQAEAFYEYYGDIMDSGTKNVFKNFISLKNKRGFEFIDTVIKYRFYKSGFMRNLGLITAFI